jgi:quinol monooxygenase YgiN
MSQAPDVEPPPPASTSQVLVTVEFAARPGRRRDLEEYLATLLPDTRAFDGSLEVMTFVPDGVEDAIVVQELWVSSDAYDAYVAWREQRDDMAPLAELVSDPPVRRRLTRIPL